MKDRPFKRIWKFITEKICMPHSDFDSAFKKDTELYDFKEFFYPRVWEVDLNSIYHSPKRPSQPDKVKRFSESLREGEELPPIKVMYCPPVSLQDTSFFTVLDGRGRIETAEKMGYQKVAVVVTDVDPHTEREVPGFLEYAKGL